MGVHRTNSRNLRGIAQVNSWQKMPVLWLCDCRAPPMTPSLAREACFRSPKTAVVMQDIFVFKPYKFVAPVRTRFFSRLSRMLKMHRHLNWRLEGVKGHEVRNAFHLQESLNRGHSIILAPNHSRTADPIALGFLGEELNLDMYAMASWHLFNVSAVMRWFIRAVGAFSVNREGLDRKAIDTAIQILVDADRPLVIFPEGSTSRTNDWLMPFLDGIGFIARAAARQRHKRDDLPLRHFSKR